VILGTMIRNILLIVFGSDGRYNKTVTIKLPSRIDPDLRLRYPDYEDPELAKLMEDEQIAERAIGVRRFFDYDNHVGIRDLPESFVDYLENEDSFLAGESEEIRKEEIDWIESAIERWKNTGDYVFWWDKDYYVNILGEVVSS